MAFASEYTALTEGVGMVDWNGRTQLEVTGEDRATFLHNFTTNDIRKLQPGHGCEAFILDARGHVLGHVFVFCTPIFCSVLNPFRGKPISFPPI